MPRTVDEILQHADDLAARFKNSEPDPAHEFDPGAIALLRAAIQERSDAERHVLEAIRASASCWHALVSHRTLRWHLGGGGPAALRPQGRVKSQTSYLSSRKRDIPPSANVMLREPQT